MRNLPIIYLILAAASLFVGCAQDTKIENVNLADTVELSEKEPSQEPAINVCVGSMITPEEGYAYYKRLIDYVGRRIGLRVNFIDKRTYGEVNALLKDGSIDIAFVCGGPYVIGNKEFGLELLAAPQVEGKTVYYSYTIVRKDSGITRLEQLRGKSFAFMDPISNTGKLVPIYILQKEFGQTPDAFFKEYLYTYDHDKSIKAVAYQVVDGAAVDSVIWNYLNKRGSSFVGQTKVINTSDAYGIPPMVVRPGLDPALKTKIKQVLLNMHEDAEGSDILKGMLIDKFVEIPDSSYDGIRKVNAAIEGAARREP